MGTKLLTETFPGAPGGSNLALPQHELDDTEARIIQDGLVDYPAIIRRRGPVTAQSNVAAFTRKGSGMATCLDPLGQPRYAVVTGDGANGYIEVLDPVTTTKVALALPIAVSASAPYRIVDAKPALNGGVMIGISSTYNANAPVQALAYWRGGYLANGTGTVTIARGSAAMTGTGFSTALCPGMWVFANTDEGYTTTLIGCVLQVNSDSSATLTSVSPYNITAKTANYQALRGVYPKVGTGTITCDTTSTAINGGKTKFQGQGLSSGTWQLYRQSDMTFVGKVSSVTSDTTITLAANAAISMSDELYVAIKADGDWSMTTTANASKPGFLSTSYSEREWYANNGGQYGKTYRLWFSDTNDPEMIDVSSDGDWIDINSTTQVNEPVEALVAVYNSVVVYKENETFAIFGSSKDTFSVKKIHDDGTLSGMSVQPYGGGAIWAGREGIYYFDGISVTNLTEKKLGDVWKNSIRTFDPTTYRMYSFIAREHYVLHIENLAPTVSIVKGNTSSTPNYWTVVINLPTQAITFATNLRFRGAITLPASSGHNVWYLVNDASKAVICDSNALFDSEGADGIATEGGTIGPDFYFETKKFSAGDALLLKRFKQIAFEYLVQGDSIRVDTVLGMNNVGTTMATTFPPTVYTWDSLRTLFPSWDAVKTTFPTWSDVILSVFVPRRARFLKRSQFLSFRLYQASSAVSRLRIGPYQIGYKLMRPGRV